MPGPLSMSGTLKMDERSSSEKGGWAGGPRKRNAVEPLAGNGRGGGLDSQLWHACAGAMVHLPKQRAKVIYFPQGHGEHAASPPEFPTALALRSAIACRVLSVHFLADTETDEVYARICLQPIDPSNDVEEDDGDDDGDDADQQHSDLPDKPVHFAKTLTQSDANNGGGFSVPRYCAETIFPRLDYSDDPPVQIVHAKDVHGIVWKFRHIYRGTPRRHLLTTGWSNFVNQKKLVAGDAIVFLRSTNGDLCVGVRRSTRGAIGGEPSSWHHAPAGMRHCRWELKPPGSSFDVLGSPSDGNACLSSIRRIASDSGSNFARNRARVTAKSVMEAAVRAAAGQPFEVVYYPRATISEFCVKARAVKNALRQSWAPGMRFKMAVETEDASRISWFMGTIAKVQEADPVSWSNSPWKMLQVTWDEPDLLQGIARVSPWQVELVSPLQLPPFPLPKKKMRSLQPFELQLDSQGIMGLTMAALPSNVLGHINPWHGVVDNVPAGMQGARHDRNFGLPIWDFQPNRSQPDIYSDSYQLQDRPLPRVSTELNMARTAHHGQTGVQNYLSTLLTIGSSSGEDTASVTDVSHGAQGVGSSTKGTSFLLFGKAIDTSHSGKSQPTEYSAGSTSDGHMRETLSDGNQSEELDKMHFFFSGQRNHSKLMETPNTLSRQRESLDFSCNEVGTLGWFKEQASILDKERAINLADNAFNHCKVFKESDELGRIIDLSSFGSYEELYGKLASIFGIEKPEILNRLVCVDTMGCSRPVGDEPYREFMQRVKRLKILSESSSESLTR